MSNYTQNVYVMFNWDYSIAKANMFVYIQSYIPVNKHIFIKFV